MTINFYDINIMNLNLVKECVKSQIIREKKVKYIHLEKKILSEILKDSPYFVTLCFTFQDEESLCNYYYYEVFKIFQISFLSKN